MNSIIEEAMKQHTCDFLAKSYVESFTYQYGEKKSNEVIDKIVNLMQENYFIIENINRHFVPLPQHVSSLIHSFNEVLFSKKENLCFAGLFIYITQLVNMRKGENEQEYIRILEELFLLHIIQFISDCESFIIDQPDNFFTLFYDRIINMNR